MKVVYSPDIFLLQRTGGISRYFVELQRELAELNIRGTLFAGISNNEYLAATKAVRIGGRTPSSVWVSRGVRAAYEGYLALQPRRTIHHPTYFTSPARQRRRPQVVTFYDLIHARFPEEMPPQDRWIVDRQRAWARLADLVLAISACTANDLVELYGVPQEKIRITPLGVRPPHRPVARHRVRGRLLYVGKRDGYKNWVAVVHALARSDRADLTLLCFGGGGPNAYERRLLDRLGVAERVSFVSGSERLLDECYETCEALVYPSRYEGFGLPPLEAMVRETPVVAADAPAIVEVVGDAARIFRADDIDDLATALVEISDIETRRGLAAAGVRRAQQFTWRRTAEATANAYSELVP